ncbi:hypothetical protein [Thiohalomonas denitrificans]|uniref:Uncharacterized protein n=1 Tax=Thiohalomonas denitrificans TaxID=415747 RepID=A0A1G5PK66_9GAMM|nr:hypothetical protein [Thiohalomonas denitrificans]SCZ49581.1 hypothetical protein SAMN03097708_00201 [Thiohalomonas denitrificans]
MKSKMMKTVLTASALSLVMGGGAVAEQGTEGQQQPTQPSAQAQQQRTISLVAGHNVVDAVDDVRETVSDLASSIANASTTAEFASWQPVAEPMENTVAELDEMEQVLDRKAENTDSSWLNWLEDRDYSVTVKQQINQLGDTLNQMANTLSQAEGRPGLQVVTGHNVVDQVDDVRETVGDLINAISNSGPGWGWFDEDEAFPQYQARLDEMEQTLDQKAEMTDEEWGTWLNEAEYHVFVQDQIQTLGEMLTSMAESIEA